eukprot:1623811-Rhodomonas_salina.2
MREGSEADARMERGGYANGAQSIGANGARLAHRFGGLAAHTKAACVPTSVGVEKLCFHFP